jgi:hypothetical protein
MPWGGTLLHAMHAWTSHLDRAPCRPQARETGICPVREELYAQCFDEIIREVTINCAERGLLLLRVRDEMRMTIAAYQVRNSERTCT